MHSAQTVMPFAVCGSRHFDAKGRRVREYVWGTVDVENENRNNFVRLREAVIRLNMTVCLESCSPGYMVIGQNMSSSALPRPQRPAVCIRLTSHHLLQDIGVTCSALSTAAGGLYSSHFTPSLTRHRGPACG